MWARRALEANLGTADALLQLTLPLLQRYSSIQPTPPAPEVKLVEADSGISAQIGNMHIPGIDFVVSYTTTTISISSASLSSLGSTPTGQATATWALTLKIQRTG